VAVVLFPPHTFGVKPVRIAPPKTLDLLRPALGWVPFTLVGYGMEIRDGRFYAPGYRKRARTSFTSLDGNWLVLANTPARGALCYGDSGSPQFLAGTNLQVSLFHDTAPTCAGTSHNQRLDTERRFLAPYLPKH
jgi:hypothetical protein